MTRIGRVGRRPDAWASPHDRAKSRAAERLDEPLEATEAAWLDEHLAGCAACLATAEAYEADRQGLRALRDTPPEPPRDLWARTAAAIEQEAAGHRRASAGPARRSPIAQWGAIAGIAVVAVVVGSSVLQDGWLASSAGTTNGVDASAVAILTQPPVASGIEVLPGATPMLVDAGAVGWFDVGADGSYAYNVANVDQVCAQVDRAGCAALDNGAGRRIALTSSPKSIITSPSSSQAIIVGSDDPGGNSVFVVALPKDPEATPSPSATPAPTPTATTAPTPIPTPAAPTTTPTPSDVASGDPSTAPSSPTPSPVVTSTPAMTPTSAVTPTPSPTMTAAPTATAAALAIVSGVTVVGDSAAFSPDGTWFAFTARPADGSAGPDLYLWRVGDPLAKVMTADHMSQFASWAGGLAVGSRPGQPLVARIPGDAPSPEPALKHIPALFTIDPTTGTETTLASRAWRPAVDPTGRRAVAWDGSVVVDDAGRTIVPTDGRLVLTTWADGASAFRSTDAIISDAQISDFTVRWDETGSWLAVWLANPADPSTGRLSLLHIDAATGKIDRPEAGPQDVPALPGFSIESGRLAWATPPSQDGEGSRVQIVAWSADGVGSIESAPGQEVVVVR